MSIFKILTAVLLLAVFTNVSAKEAAPMAEDPVLEARVMAISHELRCLVCQNQTIADSHAELAIDLRNQVREMLVAGKNEDEIVDYMVQRYGDFVRYRPPVKPETYLLWIGPFVLFFAGLILLIVNLKSRRKKLAEQAQQTISEADQKRIAEMLAQDSGDKS
jgi:cytochrome c-type biogenesis protein CcmH